ncbi:potassium channel subfamily K member 15-like [Actinia tenebrosa]|uniref:Potassium channel subfamily K member 15-like n=1 Tax=Actinia tenebrosa TaxID=6105 RepID=A0A6P8HIL6_ACTTE|nr:potassium channel subfamily K member 15-like [Actinia tenebrosa]
MAVSESTIILIIRSSIFLVYLVAGAAVFQALEQDHQRQSFENKQDLRTSITNKYNISEEDVQTWAETYRPNFQVKGDEELEWNFGNSFLFAVVTVTTIGYGNIVPMTVGGRLFCIVYAFIGIPGTCLTLKAVGDKISELTSILIEAVERRILKIKRPKKIQLKTTLFNLIFTAFLVLPLCTAIVYVREANQWTYFECFYFTFTTLTTIGYGDFVPYFANTLDFLLVIVAFIGLAFVSSILCSLNNLYEAYGISGKVVRSVTGKKDSESANQFPEENGLKEINEEDNENNPESDLKLLNKRHSKDALSGKRDSVSVAMFKA